MTDRRMQRRFTEASQLFLEAVDLTVACLGPNHRHVQNRERNLRKCALSNSDA